MNAIPSKDIIRFLKNNVEPLENPVYGRGYRASVYLTDGTYLPCVIFRNPGSLVNLALKRFKEEQNRAGYFNVVKSFVTSGNAINSYDIAKIEQSRFAFTSDIINQIRGETRMGWTGFVAKMHDDKHFGFGTTFLTEFFDIPEGYWPSDIKEIINHSYISKTGEIRSHKAPFARYSDNYSMEAIYREKPYFECYLDSLL